MADEGDEHDSELLSRLEVIEAQPLNERAARFTQLHDELLSELERGDRAEGTKPDGS